jgi:hypothetical protein
MVTGDSSDTGPSTRADYLCVSIKYINAANSEVSHVYAGHIAINTPIATESQ